MSLKALCRGLLFLLLLALLVGQLWQVSVALRGLQAEAFTVSPLLWAVLALKAVLIGVNALALWRVSGFR